jgi:uncharacterized protein YoxC
MAGAVGVSALALVLLAVFMGKVAQSTTAIRSQLEQLAPKAEAVLDSAEKTLAESRRQIADLALKASDLTVKANAALEATRL